LVAGSYDECVDVPVTVRRLAPYAIAIGGSFLITAAIGLITARAAISGLSAVYLLLVLWLGVRWGRGPAVTGSVAAFLLYDFFFVPPVGTFSVRGPAELLELGVLLAVALVTSQLAASLRLAHATAEAVASDSRALYELAIAALRTPQVTTALAMLSGKAASLRCVERFALVAVDFGQVTALEGAPLNPEELAQAAWCFENRRAIGVAITGGAIKVVRTHPETAGTSYLPLSSGVAVFGIREAGAEGSELHMLAALIGLADLLLDRRRAALEAERARGFEASDRLKAAILSSLSHELKSPIASLRAGLTALSSPQAALQAEQRELTVDMDRQAARLDHMVGDMLTLSRLEAGVELEREPHSFTDLVGTALRQLRNEFKDREVKVPIPPDLPPVEVDEVQIGRVITNLLENAIEWTPPKGAIEVGASVRGDELEAWVENEGPAIAPPDLDRVFDTFWTKRASGSGLGLAICRRVVQAHGGAIRAENRRRGPRFTFTLPLARVPAHE
jgi:two-component system, OmpR family, sensor histidine kinase KdpD